MMSPNQPSAFPVTIDTLRTPCLLLEAAKLRHNLATMRARLQQLGVGFRPHLKTAKSIDVARIAIPTPEGPAMVSTLRKAEYFAEGGVRDIIYGVGIAPDKLPRVSALRDICWLHDLATGPTPPAYPGSS